MNALRRCALALVLLLAAAPASADERIIQFISDVTVQRDGDLIVVETIQVQAEGNIIRRGIFRDFPTIYTRPDGSGVEIGFQLESVTRNGSAENTVIERLANGVRIRIGSADREIPRGQHTYVIRYRTTRQIGFFTDYDELYWNATGNGWIFPIDRAEARITLPENVPFRQTAIYTGPQGGTGRDATIVEQQGGRIVFRTTRPLPARNGLTVAAAWQKGVVEPPTAGQLAQYWLADNRGLVMAVIGLVLLLGYYAFAWRRVGRDPPSGTIIPLFAPPKGMSPAAARYVDRMSFDNECFTAAIINLGVKGHLQIIENDGKSTIKKLSGGKSLAPEETALMSKLFAGKDSLLLDQVNHVPLGRAKTGLDAALTKAYFGRLFANNYGWSTAGMLLMVVIILLVLFLVGSSVQYALFGTLFVIGIFAVPLFMVATAMIFSGWQRIDRGKWTLISGAILAALVAAAALYFTSAALPGSANLVLTGALLAMAAVAGIGFPLLRAPSRSGRKIMDDIEGFREYLGVAEEDRLNALNPPEKTPELFERFLPYAVALDCQNIWAKKFAGVLAAAGASAAATAAWYVGSRDWSSDPVSFADHLGGDLSTMISSSSTAPGSSGGGSGGSSGGGSSGGGGGGGGGGGW
ncbi:MAG: DUF2207 domain-containing protein [Rhizobiales bacterium]|nr:DUF2207 domain-containing protein [Hyphomicrobiales bacterium]